MRTRMRTPALRSRFRMAWGAVPPAARAQLRSFIRYVDEVPELEGACIYGRLAGSKSVDLIEGPLAGGASGYATVMDLRSGRAADVLLPSKPLAECDDGMALAIILHEIAHVQDYRDNSHAAAERGTFSAERLAWNQAVAWALDSNLGHELKSAIQLYIGLATIADTEREMVRLFTFQCLGSRSGADAAPSSGTLPE